jgi:hypothetical protein
LFSKRVAWPFCCFSSRLPASRSSHLRLFKPIGTYTSRLAEGTPVSQDKRSVWKAAYDHGRAFWNVSERCIGLPGIAEKRRIDRGCPMPVGEP